MSKGLWAVLAATLLGAGCASSRVASDQDCLRRAVLDLNTNQIMDNLIRLDKGLPIVHIDYSQLTGQVTDSMGAEGDLEQTVQNTQALPLIITRQLMNVWTGKLTASRQNQVSVTGQPVTGNPEVYNAYLRFYAKPGALVKTAEPPPPGAAVLVRCAEAVCEDLGCGARAKGHWWCRHKPEVVYYWVPCAFKEDFRELCLYTVALRGEIQAVPDYFEATILGVTDPPPAEDEEKKGEKKDEKEDVAKGKVKGEGKDKPKGAKKDDADKGQVTVVIVLDKKVPNAEGYMIATIKGRIYDGGKKVLKIYPLITPQTPPAQPADPEQDEKISTTNRLLLTFAYGPGERRVQATPDDAFGDLAKQTVRLKFDRFNPAVPRTSDLLRQIRDQLELIRMGQQLQRVP